MESLDLPSMQRQRAVSTENGSKFERIAWGVEMRVLANERYFDGEFLWKPLDNSNCVLHGLFLWHGLWVALYLNQLMVDDIERAINWAAASVLDELQVMQGNVRKP
jgi:hypothetical protein